MAFDPNKLVPLTSQEIQDLKLKAASQQIQPTNNFQSKLQALTPEEIQALKGGKISPEISQGNLLVGQSGELPEIIDIKKREEFAKKVTKIAREIPSLGGMVIGGILGGGPAGAGLGGAIGEFLAQQAEKIGGERKNLSTTDIATAGVTGTLSELGGNIAGKALTKLHGFLPSWAETVVSKAVGPFKNKEVENEILNSVKQELGLEAKNTLARDFLNIGNIDTAKGLIHQSIPILRETGKQMDQILFKKGKEVIPLKGIPDIFNNYINNIQNVLGEEAAVPLKKIQEIYLSKGEQITANEAVKLYRGIYEILGDKAFNVANPNLTPAKEALKKIAGNLSNRVSSIIPEMAPLNLRYGLWSEVQANVLARMAKTKLSTAEKIAIGAITPTFFLNPPAAAATGAVLGFKRAITSTPSKLTVGFTLDALDKAIEEIPDSILKIGGKTAKTAIFNALNTYFSNLYPPNPK